MAQMYPVNIKPNTKSRAERKLFSAFKDQLSDQFHVFHSIRWQLPGRLGLEDGETDFVIAHPRHGILILEVKGGQIAYDGQLGKWISGTIEIADPIEQALRSKYSLINLMKSDPRLKDEWILVGYAIALPDVVVEGRLLPELARPTILDGEDINDLGAWVERAFEYWRGRSERQSTQDRRFIHHLSRLLAPSWDLRPRLAQQFDEEEREIESLTQEQLYILDLLSRERRVAIAGCAGAGKTILATEKALRLADSGFKVAFICFNANLADHINNLIGADPKIDVATFHALCLRLCKKAGMELPRQSAEKFFSESLLESTFASIDKLGPQYDAIVVDEGQDFQADWWLILDSLLRARERDVFYIFFDDNQLLYQPHFEIPLQVADVRLTKNLRNTQRIHAFAKRFYASDVDTIAEGPEGRPIEFHSYETGRGLHQALRKVLHRLIVEEDVDASNVVILTPKSRSRSELWKLAPFGNFDLIGEPPGGGAEVYCTTVHSFKGLERPVVILAELDKEAAGNPQALLYVGATRACSHLIVMGDPIFLIV